MAKCTRCNDIKIVPTINEYEIAVCPECGLDRIYLVRLFKHDPWGTIEASSPKEAALKFVEEFDYEHGCDTGAFGSVFVALSEEGPSIEYRVSIKEKRYYEASL